MISTYVEQYQLCFMKRFSQKFSCFKKLNNFLKMVIKHFMNEIFASLS